MPCGVGQRTRDVKCVSNIGDIVDDEECNMKLRPNDIENCDMGPCAKSWFLTEWSDRVSIPDALHCWGTLGHFCAASVASYFLCVTE